MASNILSYAGWYFLPNLVTSYAQSFLYTIFIRAGSPKPVPGSPRHTRDRQRIHACVILAYLFYTIYEADYQLRQAGDFYQALGVSHDVGEKALQSRFRKLTVQYHPDKSPNPSAEAESYYLSLRLARDTLIDPAKRFAYDRFGPDILLWRGSKTIRDYVFTGIQQTSVHYFASAAFLVLLSVLGYLPRGKYWRFWAMGAMYVVEIWVATRSRWPWVLTGVVNPAVCALGLGGRTGYLPFQVLALGRKWCIAFFIALSQLAPILSSSEGLGQSAGALEQQQLDRLDALARTMDQEVTRLMGLELSPFVGGDGEGFKELRNGMREWLVQNTVRNDPEVKSAVQRVLERRRGADRDG